MLFIIEVVGILRVLDLTRNNSNEKILNLNFTSSFE